MKQVHKQQSGFTLVEIAIVLVIIGLLLGGVLKGQSMIENAKVKTMAQEFNSVSTMLYAYQDKFKALPGDDNQAVAHQAAAIQATALTAGNGQIETGTWKGASIAAALTESSVFWNHVRLAGLSSGPTTTGAAGTGENLNAVGGYLGITTNANHPTVPLGTAGNFVTCSSNINGKLSHLLDIALDDGLSASGNLYAAAETSGPLIAPAVTTGFTYLDNSLYTVCQSF